MSDLFRGFIDLPAYAIGAIIVLILYVIQTEVRFGAKARTIVSGAADRGSTLLLSIVSVIPALGFVLAVKTVKGGRAWVPIWLRGSGPAVLPGMPAVAWIGVILAALGVLLRLWAVLTLRERYTRTLLIQDTHTIERGGPYRWVRHPGYLGSLLCFNGVALASGNGVVLLLSMATTFAAYAYRVHVEDAMLVARFGASYEGYRQQVGGLLPFIRPSAKG